MTYQVATTSDNTSGKSDNKWQQMTASATTSDNKHAILLLVNQLYQSFDESKLMLARHFHWAKQSIWHSGPQNSKVATWDGLKVTHQIGNKWAI